MMGEDFEARPDATLKGGRGIWAEAERCFRRKPILTKTGERCLFAGDSRLHLLSSARGRGQGGVRRRGEEVGRV